MSNKAIRLNVGQAADFLEDFNGALRAKPYLYAGNFSIALSKTYNRMRLKLFTIYEKSMELKKTWRQCKDDYIILSLLRLWFIEQKIDHIQMRYERSVYSNIIVLASSRIRRSDDIEFHPQTFTKLCYDPSNYKHYNTMTSVSPDTIRDWIILPNLLDISELIDRYNATVRNNPNVTYWTFNLKMYDYLIPYLPEAHPLNQYSQFKVSGIDDTVVEFQLNGGHNYIDGRRLPLKFDEMFDFPNKFALTASVVDRINLKYINLRPSQDNAIYMGFMYDQRGIFIPYKLSPYPGRSYDPMVPLISYQMILDELYVHNPAAVEIVRTAMSMLPTRWFAELHKNQHPELALSRSFLMTYF